MGIHGRQITHSSKKLDAQQSYVYNTRMTFFYQENLSIHPEMINKLDKQAKYLYNDCMSCQIIPLIRTLRHIKILHLNIKEIQ